MGNFGLTDDVLHEWNPDLVILSMPAFGLHRALGRVRRLRPDDRAAVRAARADRLPRRPTGAQRQQPRRPVRRAGRVLRPARHAARRPPRRPHRPVPARGADQPAGAGPAARSSSPAHRSPATAPPRPRRRAAGHLSVGGHRPLDRARRRDRRPSGRRWRPSPRSAGADDAVRRPPRPGRRTPPRSTAPSPRGRPATTTPRWPPACRPPASPPHPCCGRPSSTTTATSSPAGRGRARPRPRPGRPLHRRCRSSSRRRPASSTAPRPTLGQDNDAVLGGRLGLHRERARRAPRRPRHRRDHRAVTVPILTAIASAGVERPASEAVRTGGRRPCRRVRSSARGRPGRSANTSCHVPAAAHTSSKASRSGSTNTRQLRGVAERRHAADRVPGGGAHGVGVDPGARRPAGGRRQLALVELVGAADVGQHDVAVDAEDQALDDLARRRRRSRPPRRPPSWSRRGSGRW